ncbi:MULTISPECIES: hypothetical protein [Clostridium]|uniref:hypothetical protein n=1 Tax=Clostridium TaxID=1485 RepID=UPI000A9B6493|nr:MULTISPECIES: hypothetical protein [Clostridium]MCD2349015.1 hypothetical protein [Clostridium guangxiense]
MPKVKKKATRIYVSFKQTTRDMKLYTYVEGLEEKSDFVKDAIEFYIKHLKKSNQSG